MKIGYARVSSHGQSLDTQIEKLKNAGCDKIFQEKKSGASTSERKALNDALEFCREGDVLIVTKIDRLARSLFNLQDILQTLERKKVDFIVLDQNIETASSAGRLTFHIIGAIAEFERDIINDRRVEGMLNAKKRGIKWGPKKKLSSEKENELRKAWDGGNGLPREELLKTYGISRATFYRTVSETNSNDTKESPS